jgi:hypothetical protein
VFGKDRAFALEAYFKFAVVDALERRAICIWVVVSRSRRRAAKSR